jgi:FMN phosphatase YigB (HAD superfamily)
MSKSFGFDLDNTLIDYSAAVEEYCRIKNLTPCTNIGMLREQLRKNHLSDYDWQLAQGWLYTEGLQFAQAGLGSGELCSYLIQEGYKLYIVSHKTSHTPDFCGKIALHGLANNWIKKSVIANYFKHKEQIFYEPTRELKVKKIRELALNYFVDDLEEVFKESEFPANTKSFLIYKNRTQIGEIECVRNFIDIKEAVTNGF